MLSKAYCSISFYIAKLLGSICAPMCFHQSNAGTIDEHMWTLITPIREWCMIICKLSGIYFRGST